MNKDAGRRLVLTWGDCLWRLLTRTDGQDLAEYGIALAVIGTAAIFAAIAIGGNVNTLWTTIQPRIAFVAGAV